MTAQTCGISIAHGTDETVCAVTYFLVYLLTSWCLESGYGKMKMKKRRGEIHEDRMFFVEAGAENSVAAGCVSAAISMLYLESADAAIPVGAFAGYAFRSWLRHLFCGSGELDGCVPADPN